MTYLRILPLSLLLISSMGWAEEQVPIVGFDKHHKEVTVNLSQDQYEKTFSNIVTTVHHSTIAALEAGERNASHVDDSKPYWMLRDVTVGIGLTFTAGLGPLYTISGAPRVRMCFSNSTHPKFPD